MTKKSNKVIPDLGDALTNLPELKVQPKDTSKGHFYVSLVKSVLRIGAGASLVMVGFPEAGTFFIVAEILGIVEELV